MALDYSLMSLAVTSTILSCSLFLFLLPCQAQNNAPTLKLSIALVGADGKLTASEAIHLHSLLALLEVVDDDEGPGGKVTCRSESHYVGLAPMRSNLYKIQLDKPLDRETTATVDVNILCTDKGTPPLSEMAVFTIIVQDANDNIPTFSTPTYTFSIMENSQPNVSVGQVVAVDMDINENGMVSYFLEDENGENPNGFVIDERTGEIICTELIDRETNEEIVLYVYASDHGFPPLDDQAEIVILIGDINDNSPTILSKNFTVDEGLKPMSFVGTLKASDKDSDVNGEVEFRLVTGDGLFMPPFIIDPSGAIYAAVPLDRERRDEYVLQVSASDLGVPSLSTTANITIIVRDVNDHPPTIVSPKEFDDFHLSTGNSSDSISIDWYIPDKDKVVFKVHAYDKDIQENGRIFYSIDSINSKNVDDDSLFEIDRETGHVYLRRVVRIDDDPVQALSFLVSDGGNPSLNATASLNVTLDVDFQALATPPSSTSGMSRVNSGVSGNGKMSSSFLSVFCGSFVLVHFLFVYIINLSLT